MEGGSSTTSPLDTLARSVDQQAIAAFKRLASEKRLAILLALWESYEPFEDDNAVRFSVLRKRVGIRDKGQFHYHLDKLNGHLVRRTESGYELRRAGHEIVQTVLAGAGIEDTSLDLTEIDLTCYLCGAPTAVTYEDEMIFWMCTECDGLYDRDDVLSGTLAGAEFDPAGLTDRRPRESLNAAWNGDVMQSVLGGVCDACSGSMEGWLHLCEDHAAEGLCPNCGWRDAAVARFVCTVCKRHHQMVPWWLVINHPAVVAFYYERGVPLLYESNVNYQPRIESNLQAGHDQELVSTDPPLVRITIQYDDDELALTMDEELMVVDISGGE